MSDANKAIPHPVDADAVLHEVSRGQLVEAAMDAVPDLVYIVGRDNRLTYWNRALGAVSGYTPDEIAVMPATEFFLEDDRPRVAEAIERCWQEGLAPVEARILTKTGEVLPYGFDSSLCTDADGKPIALCGVGRSLREQKRQEAKLQHLNRALRAIQEVSRVSEHQLRERVKEMRCLLELSKLVDKSQSDLSTILSELPALLVRAWQHSEVAVAKVVIDGEIHESEGFEETVWRQVAAVAVNDRMAGAVEVCYLAERPEADEGPFLEQERHLLDAIAERLGRIIERVRAIDTLRESEERFRTITSAANDAIVMTDESGNIVFWNEAAERIFGYSAADVIGANAATLLAGDAAERLCQTMTPRRQAFNDSEPVEFDAKCASGKVVPVECSSSAVKLNRGWCTISILRDITDRRRVEEERARDLQRMESLLTLNHMGDQPLRDIIAYAVEESIRLTGSTIGYLAVMNEDETVLTMQYWSKSAHDACATIEKPLVYQVEETGLWGEAVRQRKPVITNDYDAPNPHKRGLPKGHVPVVRHMNIPVFDGERIVAVAGVGNKPADYDDHDVRQLQLLMEGWRQIVERKRAKEVLIEARRSAESATRAKSEFLANMSHEIRTPMTAILGFTDILLADLSNSETRDAAETIKRNGEHLLAIINDILDISKIEAGRLDVEMQRCSPEEVVSTVLSLLEVRAEEQGILLSQECETPLPASILTDPARLQQILTNIVGNAVKFTESGSVRVVSRLIDAETANPKIQFDVIDTGIGIEDRDIATLFEPFTQADGSSNRKFEGTGLGLAISRRLARMLGGDVQVESEFGKGSTFRITIDAGPLEDVDAVGLSTEEMSPPPSIADDRTESTTRLNCRVLLVEDSPDNQRLIGAMLSRAGAHVTVAADGKKGIEMAMASCPGHGRRDDDLVEPFDVILTDIQMPVLDGYEVTRCLRQQGYTAPIVALTAHAMQEHREACLNAGCDDYLTKPVDREELRELVAKWAAVAAGRRREAADVASRLREEPSPARAAARDDGNTLAGNLHADSTEGETP